MDIAFTDLKEKEIINVADGKKLGHIIDFLFDIENGQVKGVVVPGQRKIFRKTEDIFIPLEQIRKIGGDVILVKLRVLDGEEIVVDWRAPVADLYYSGTGGDAYYKAPMGVVEGELNLKRKFLFKENSKV